MRKSNQGNHRVKILRKSNWKRTT